MHAKGKGAKLFKLFTLFQNAGGRLHKLFKGAASITIKADMMPERAVT